MTIATVQADTLNNDVVQKAYPDKLHLFNLKHTHRISNSKNNTGFILVDEDLRVSVNLIHERRYDVINACVYILFSKQAGINFTQCLLLKPF